MPAAVLFDSWASLGKVLLSAVLTYPLLILVLRLGGKRTLAKMNAFDFVVTVAIGSIVASTLLSTAPVVNGVGAVATLVALQAAVTWLSVRSDRFEALVKSQPTLVFHDGTYLDGPMRAERVTREEIRGAIRDAGHAGTDGVAAVVLESDGAFSVLARVPAGDETAVEGAAAMAGVSGAAEHWDTGNPTGPFTNPTRGPLAG
ncbi:DUF421 domain-containing protein [Rubrivirga marina]|uniref:YetF C-terminal domain-containing protein n=1 Tax=Rubrivirga marina TaxID=1196024 RepID=A0A271J3T5_9BACT|nr:YetF domain-containing protein [Rubrivirga marina]PAP78103.1 hypothetical protein BSZ37_17500 [Rubrivirga marina]